MTLDDWMQGYLLRQTRMGRRPVVRQEEGYDVDVRQDRGEWLVTVRRTDVLTREEKAEARFLGWYAVTGDRDDAVPTDEVRHDYWLAHQDVGLPLPQSKRGRGVHVLADSDPAVARGRGVVRGVVRGDDIYEDAERLLREEGLTC